MTPSHGTLTENGRPGGLQALPPIDEQLVDVLAHFPGVMLAVLFGSVALGRQRPDSDLDIAVAARQALTAAEKMALIEALAERTGRPVDLIDLKVVGEPLLGQIVRHGRRLLGSDGAYGQLISRHLFEQADFMPYHSRVLAERRAAWIGM
jgi:predicted nucleotidyltransferase